MSYWQLTNRFISIANICITYPSHYYIEFNVNCSQGHWCLATFVHLQLSTHKVTNTCLAYCFN